jgi:hypothetical protein
MLELLGPAMSITTVALLARSGLRAWRAENRFLKWGGTGLAAFFSAAASLIRVILIVGLFRLRNVGRLLGAKRTYDPDNFFSSAILLSVSASTLAAE